MSSLNAQPSRTMHPFRHVYVWANSHLRDVYRMRSHARSRGTSYLSCSIVPDAAATIAKVGEHLGPQPTKFGLAVNLSTAKALTLLPAIRTKRPASRRSPGCGCRRTTYAPLSSAPATVSSVTIEVASLAAEVAGLGVVGLPTRHMRSKTPLCALSLSRCQTHQCVSASWLLDG